VIFCSVALIQLLESGTGEGLALKTIFEFT
jgi:hypothetical protein